MDRIQALESLIHAALNELNCIKKEMQVKEKRKVNEDSVNKSVQKYLARKAKAKN